MYRQYGTRKVHDPGSTSQKRIPARRPDPDSEKIQPTDTRRNYNAMLLGLTEIRMY